MLTGISRGAVAASLLATSTSLLHSSPTSLLLSEPTNPIQTPSTYSPPIPHQASEPSWLNNTSACFFAPQHGVRMANVDVWITNKTTAELGDLGSGLHDNVNGFCRFVNVGTWKLHGGLGYGENFDGEVVSTGYYVSFTVAAQTNAVCVEDAIRVAEMKTVTCVPPPAGHA